MSTVLQKNVYQLNEETPWREAAPGIERQLFGYDDKIMMVKVKFEKDSIGILHEHFHSQVSYIESGIFELTIGEDIKIG